jgi:ammonia channel protein AmtB
VVLYAGLIKSKWAVYSASMAFYAFTATLVVWVLWEFKLLLVGRCSLCRQAQQSHGYHHAAGSVAAPFLPETLKF